MSNVVAGIGRGQLRVLEKRIENKNIFFESYKEAFKAIDYIDMAPICQYGEPNYWLSIITLKRNQKLSL